MSLRIDQRRAWRHEMAAAFAKTRVWVPKGNTGAARVSALRPMPVPPDLDRYVD